MNNLVDVRVAPQSTLWASPTLTNYGRHTVFASSPLNGCIDEWLIGGFDSREDAAAAAKRIVDQIGAPDVLLSSRELQPAEHESIFAGHTKEDLIGSLEGQITKTLQPPSWETFTSLYRSPRFFFRIIYLLAIIEFIFGFQITIPKDLDVPLIGGLVAGWSLERHDVAFYLPFALLILFAATLPGLIKRSFGNDRVRRLVVELAIFHDVRRADISNAINKEIVLGEGAFAISGAQSLMNGVVGKILGVRGWRPAPATGGGQEMIELATQEEIDSALDLEFERRIHNLYWLGRQKRFSSLLLVFDPLMYAISTNRVRWALYQRAIEKGVYPATLPLVSNPDDPASEFRDGRAIIVITLFLSLPLIWAFFLIGSRTFTMMTLHILASILFVAFYAIWIWQAVVRRRGFPLKEPIGAYTVDVLPRQLMLPGY